MSTYEDLQAAQVAQEPPQGETASSKQSATPASGSLGAWWHRQFTWVSFVKVMLILGLAAVVMIAERNYYYRLWLEQQRLLEELENLRSESVSLGAELMALGQESQVIEYVNEQGLPLQQASKPAVVIELVKP